jgi:hypothetical protein
MCWPHTGNLNHVGKLLHKASNEELQYTECQLGLQATFLTHKWAVARRCREGTCWALLCHVHCHT